jgi:hypothetical protein
VHRSRAEKDKDSLMPSGGSSMRAATLPLPEDIGVGEKNPPNPQPSGALETHDASLVVIDNNPIDQWELGRSPSKIAHRRLGIPNDAGVTVVCSFLREK